MTHLCDLRTIEELLSMNPTSKKKRLHRRFCQDLSNLVSKYEYMYNKYILHNRRLQSITNEKEKNIAIVQKTIATFFPYIIAYNMSQLMEDCVENDLNTTCYV